MYYWFNVKFDLFQSYGLCIIFYGKISVLVSLSNVPMLPSCHNKTASPSHQPDGVLTDLLAGPAVHHGRLGGVDQVGADHGVLSEAQQTSERAGSCGLPQPLADIGVENISLEPGGQVQHRHRAAGRHQVGRDTQPPGEVRDDLDSLAE